MNVRHVAREVDNEILQWMFMRCHNFSSSEIAAPRGIRPERVRVATYRVMQADIAESGENAQSVRAGYWL